ncbi:hypothetical protein O6H91_18G030400 [Diphasiastrum complanatum]|uniref:Uncharacterized protein n=1 Tax=Diphasiastrum complanatum TaxID=34168 RepID=A0ACC2AZG8_DIPCM|nr:hypothetical protein O6H91_18G030400 [Diphasiastrum complanatum]
MRQLLRKFHLGGNHYDRLDAERILEARGPTVDAPASASTPVDHRSSSGFSAWLSSVGRHGAQTASSSNQVTNSRQRPQSPIGSTGVDIGITGTGASPVESGGTQLDFQFMEEEYQVQLAMALSMSKDERPDPEMLEIEAVKKISLGLCPTPSNSHVEALAYRYWAYHVLDYDDRVLDGFYDVYGVSNGDISDRMPSLFDLQGAAISESSGYEVVLVNRVTDYDLVKLEKRVTCLGMDPIVSNNGPLRSGLAQKIADVVAEQMGGPVESDVELLALWKTTSWELKSFAQNIVLPLGALQIGLARHRALLFKVLADCVGIPCRLVKGRYYTGVDDGAVNILKDDDDREYIVDLIGAPGALIPLDSILNTAISDQMITCVTPSQEPLSKSQSSGSGQRSGEYNKGMLAQGSLQDDVLNPENVAMEDSKDKKERCTIVDIGQCDKNIEAKPSTASFSDCDNKASTTRTNYEKIETCHHQSPIGAAGMLSPPGVETNPLNLSSCTIDVKADSFNTAQNSQDVMLEEGNLSGFPFKASSKEFSHQTTEWKVSEDKKGVNERKRNRTTPRHRQAGSVGPGRPPVRVPRQELDSVQEDDDNKLQRLKSIEELDDRHQLNSYAGRILTTTSLAETSVTGVQDNTRLVSSVEPSFATPAIGAFSKGKGTVEYDIAHDFDSRAQYSQNKLAAVTPVTSPLGSDKVFEQSARGSGSQTQESKGLKLDETYATCSNSTGSSSSAQDQSHCGPVLIDEGFKEDKKYSLSNAQKHSRFESMLGDAAEWEILWEDLSLGERIGLGSYGEVYHGDWHGTEVAVKKFLDQDISGDALEEFRREVRMIMRRLRHPNVVLFMGAVARAPNLSIVTEYLPRGSLYKLIHRPNNELDERRRLRMALDVARGMNYLHNSTPIIVHRDLKSPNLLVDKNWVVKVCDFGLSRMKHNTFLSSMSTAGTPEWMAPEVLRNEPSNEKSDVYSFGVILWELATSQQPWSGLNPMQVVGAVGFQHRRLQIPQDTDPQIAQIIQDCWQNDSSLRPSFSQIMTTLKPLQRPVLAPQPYDYYRHIPQ